MASVTGNRTKVKVVKNKLASPFREAEFDIIYGEGISKEGDLIDLGVANNVIEKSGSWFSYKGERIGQGRENARQFLKDHPDMWSAVDIELRQLLGLTSEGTGRRTARRRQEPTGRRRRLRRRRSELGPARFEDEGFGTMGPDRSDGAIV